MEVETVSYTHLDVYKRQAFGAESNDMKYCESANFGKSELMHFGADTFMGHQEIMGTLPKRDVYKRQE